MKPTPPELDPLSRILTSATIINLGDLWAAERGVLAPREIRQLTIDDACAAPSVPLLSLPTRLIRQLGLAKAESRRGQEAMYEPVRLTIQGRTCTMDVMEVPDSIPALIGYIPLGHLDLVVDEDGRRLIGNPAHGGKHVYELY
jgi:hypothetical protein